jgi:hypothetical protein
MPPIDVQWIWLCHCLNPVSVMFTILDAFTKLRFVGTGGINVSFDSRAVGVPEVLFAKVWAGDRLPHSPGRRKRGFSAGEVQEAVGDSVPEGAVRHSGRSLQAPRGVREVQPSPQRRRRLRARQGARSCC